MTIKGKFQLHFGVLAEKRSGAAICLNNGLSSTVSGRHNPKGYVFLFFNQYIIKFYKVIFRFRNKEVFFNRFKFFNGCFNCVF